MKPILFILASIMLSCTPQTAEPSPPMVPLPTPPSEPETPPSEPETPQNQQMKITINGHQFEVSLEKNATVDALLKLLPTTFDMHDLNDNEKYTYLSVNLPTASSAVTKINVGDLMLFGSNCLVLFYAEHRSSYSYTRIGRLQNAAQLSDLVGRKSISVKFE